MAKLTPKEENLRAQLISLGQEHVWAHCESLERAIRQEFIAALIALDFESLKNAIHIARSSERGELASPELKPALSMPLPRSAEDRQHWQCAKEAGEEMLASGKVAALTVAGGQGTRLGFSGPKGCLGVTPLRHKSLFQVFAEKILAAQQRYKKPFFWLIMTSHINSEPTKTFFAKNNFFGLRESQVIFFQQGLFPSLDFKGKLIIESLGRLAMSPDGHGGTFDALARSGNLAYLREKGVEVLSYFQVDNPLVRVFDPYFIGFHRQQASSMSSKMVVKKNPQEKVGLFCFKNDSLSVVEYSDIPEVFANERDEEGQLRFRAGNIAVHLINGDFAERIAQQHSLPFHCAKKVIPFLNTEGDVERPQEPNGIKFEKFVFDGLHFASNPFILETLREEEFSPVKNATGPDSLETSMRDQSLLCARWIDAAGGCVPRDSEGNLLYKLEVSPLFADDAETFFEKWTLLQPKPSLDQDLYLE